jgi:hypothetical protein
MRGKSFFALGFVLLLSAVSTHAQTSRDAPEVPPPDESFLDQPFGACKAKPAKSVVLTPAEQCWSKKLAARCTKSDDCLVSCLATGVARDLGDGCWHACFQYKFKISQWVEPQGVAACRKLGKVNGI